MPASMSLPSGNARSLRLFTAGITLFSGSLYAMVLSDTPKLGAITPIGGLLLIGAWLSLLGWISLHDLLVCLRCLAYSACSAALLWALEPGQAGRGSLLGRVGTVQAWIFFLGATVTTRLHSGAVAKHLTRNCKKLQKFLQSGIFFLQVSKNSCNKI